MAEFGVYVAKSDFKFNAAHFIAYKGFRERMHGHNYSISVKVTGTDKIGPDGYLIDFGDVKKAARSVCKEMNEYFICPMKSDALTITEDGGQLCMTCEDGSIFSMPKSDCMMLPLVHSSAEELAHYIWCRIMRTIGVESMLSRGLKNMEVSVSEAPQQTASFTAPIPLDEDQLLILEQCPIKSRPQPCFENV